MIAGPEDEAALQAYFDESPDDTIWLRIAHAEGCRFAIEKENGRIVGMATHNNELMILVHGRPALAKEIQRPFTRINAVAGRPDDMKAALEVLGLTERPVARLSREILMSVEIDKLVLPELLSRTDVKSRRALPTDLPLLIDWRKRYFAEVHAMVPTEAAIAEVTDDQSKGRLWVLEVGGDIVNTAAFSAVFPHLVQIEYAWGPPELRAQKYGRSAVAGALAAVSPEGIKRAVFNTDEKNVAVQQGIAPIGFRKTGDYHATVFA